MAATDFALGLNLSGSVFDLPQTPLFGTQGPTPAAWTILNNTVGGRLYPGEPWAKSCFSVYNGQQVEPDSAACEYVQKNYFNHHLERTSQFGGFGALQFETCMTSGDQCHLDWTNASNPKAFASEQQCNQGSVSPFYIDVKNKDDVLAAYEFSKKVGVTLSIKNSGHDFKGRSSAPDSLSLWMHNLKYISHEDTFVADGCDVAGQPAITFGAGTQFHDVYEYAEKHGLLVIGGSDQSVGPAGGWGQGGGHSPLSPAHGMGSDRTLQYKIVTPDGVYRTVNACQNEDLFFALRGGGGGTFGVVLEMTMLTSKLETLRMANINWPVDNDNLKSVLDIFLANITSFALDGWGGYLTPTIGNLVLISPKVDLPTAEESMKALVDLTTKLGGKSTVTEIPHFYDWFKGWVAGTNGEQDPIGLNVVLTSRLVPARNHDTESSREQLRDALLSTFANSAFPQIHIATPYGFKGSDGSDTSVHPAWRTTLYQVISVNSWFWDSTLEDKKNAYQVGKKAIDFLRDITPDGAAYSNESDVYEPDWEVSFWGEHYPRLLEIKKKYDPEHILDCWHCVGWKGAESSQYKCYI